MVDLSSLNGPAPTDEELADAPTVIDWTIRESFIKPGEFRIWCYVDGHPNYVLGEAIYTSRIKWIDPSSPPKWAVCESRVYRFGEPKRD